MRRKKYGDSISQTPTRNRIPVKSWLREQSARFLSGVELLCILIVAIIFWWMAYADGFLQWQM